MVVSKNVKFCVKKKRKSKFAVKYMGPAVQNIPLYEQFQSELQGNTSTNYWLRVRIFLIDLSSDVKKVDEQAWYLFLDLEKVDELLPVKGEIKIGVNNN